MPLSGSSRTALDSTNSVFYTASASVSTVSTVAALTNTNGSALISTTAPNRNVRGVILQNDPASTSNIIVTYRSADTVGLTLVPGAKEFFPLADLSKIYVQSSGATLNIAAI